MRQDSLAWYVHRLRAMEPAEVLWRGGRLARDLGLVPRRRPARLPAAGCGQRHFALLDPVAVRAAAEEHPDAAAEVLMAAREALEHRFRFFGNPPAPLGPEIDWHHEPLTGHRWPAVPSRRIDYRFGDQDPKWIWELNRLQHLPVLVEAWMITGETRFVECAAQHLRSWLGHNPPGHGIAWLGGFEAGVRAMSVSVTLRALRCWEGLDPGLESRVLGLLARSAEKCWAERSLFSSANNHLVGEMGGVAVSSILFPELPRSRRDEERALAVLAREADRQILPDGAGVERSLRYHLFTADVFLLVVAALVDRGDPPPDALVGALRRSAAYLGSLVHPGESTPWYGDDDESFALRLQAERTRSVQAHLSALDAVMGWPRRPAGDDFAAAVLRGGLGGRTALATEPPPPARDLVAPDGGLVVLRSRTGRRLLVDVGPLGQAPIAAHGHADALSVTLDLHGVAVVVDPGTGSYYRHRDWREAHRATRAHATVEVDDLSQSVPGGLFLWTRGADVRRRHVDVARGLVDAEHDGYTRLPDPVLHRRWVVAPPDEEGCLVVDLCAARGEHRYRVGWPLSSDAGVERLPDGHLVTVGGHPVRFTYGASVPVEVFASRGDDEAQLGWTSPHLEERVPAWHIGTVQRARGPWAHVTSIRSVTGPETPPAPVEVTVSEDRLVVREGAGGDVRTLVIGLAGAGDVTVVDGAGGRRPPVVTPAVT
ncbi:alginate lyase family protein [Geodermatophilus aquaeductus]|uniref:Heparinase II/III N-terminus n=1 Tax=Geodermatophilus aquaeductus TaxID=1564161 RepID=A0A521CNK9_9ACTN|nr:alginate lyase family protein [Geodermatophilus aquaeductus]SMO61044.1 Heparinase II/III N-terminus [Geodermatophilus aquaeductus]